MVVTSTPQSGRQFAASTNDLANGTSVNLFGTSSKVQALAIDNVPGKHISLNFIYFTLLTEKAQFVVLRFYGPVNPMG